MTEWQNPGCIDSPDALPPSSLDWGIYLNIVCQGLGGRLVPETLL